MATLYKCENAGEWEEVVIEPENGTNFRLPELYRMLGCELVDVVRLHTGEILIVDDCGKLTKRPGNEPATRIAAANAGIAPWDWIAGSALLCADDEFR